MALYQELTGQGRVIGGHLAGGSVLARGANPFSKNGDLSIQHPSNPFKRHRINADTVREWEELDPAEGVAGAVGKAAARAALPGIAGKVLGAGLGAALKSGHTVCVSWSDGKQSIIGFPEKQFMVFSVLLKDSQVTTEFSPKPETDTSAGATRSFAARTDEEPVPDATEQIAKLARLHAQGILTDAEFADKKTELLKRL